MKMYNRDDLKDMMGKSGSKKKRNSDSDKDGGFLEEFSSTYMKILSGAFVTVTNVGKNIGTSFLNMMKLSDQFEKVSKELKGFLPSKKQRKKKWTLKWLKKTVKNSDIGKHFKESLDYNFKFWKDICKDLLKKTKNYKKTWKNIKKSKMAKRKYWRRRWKKVNRFMTSIRKDLFKQE